jgi:hypothetical protein
MKDVETEVGDCSQGAQTNLGVDTDPAFGYLHLAEVDSEVNISEVHDYFLVALLYQNLYLLFLASENLSMRAVCIYETSATMLTSTWCKHPRVEPT